MAYYTEDELRLMGFKSLGRNVKISSKASIYDCDRIAIGDHSRIDDFCVVSGNITIGRHVHITPMCLLAGGEPGLVIEDFCACAYGVKIFTQSDDYSGHTMTNSTVPKQYKDETMAAVRIGRHSILGAGATVLPGVMLAEGTAVGAMALVLASTAPWGVYAGVPAERIKERSRELLALEAQFRKEASDDTV